MATKVTGRELLRRTLAKLPKAVKVELQKSLTADAQTMIAKMKSRINDKSGTLSASVREEPFTKGGIGVIIKAGGPTTTKPVRKGQSAKYDYAMGVELGTQDALAAPFFFPTYRQSRAKIKRGASKAVQRAVESVKK